MFCGTFNEPQVADAGNVESEPNQVKTHLFKSNFYLCVYFFQLSNNLLLARQDTTDDELIHVEPVPFPLVRAATI